jgi:hypothetical protein
VRGEQATFAWSVLRGRRVVASHVETVPATGRLTRTWRPRLARGRYRLAASVALVVTQRDGVASSAAVRRTRTAFTVR